MSMTADITAALHQLTAQLVDRVPGVVGALVSSADGFTLAANLPASSTADPAALGAMSSAAIALSTRLAQSVGEQPATISHHRSADGQVFVFAVEHVAVLTLLAAPDASIERIDQVGRQASDSLFHQFCSAAV